MATVPPSPRPSPLPCRCPATAPARLLRRSSGVITSHLLRARLATLGWLDLLILEGLPLHERAAEPSNLQVPQNTPPGYPGVAALQNPEAAKLLAQMRAPAFPAEMDLQVGDLPWAAFKRTGGRLAET